MRFVIAVGLCLFCLQAKALTLIDVRSAEEYRQGHVDGAINIVHTDIVSGVAALDVPKTETIELYCRSGRRSAIAKDLLEAAGYSHVVNLGGYTDALKKVGSTNK